MTPQVRRICADEGPRLRALRLHALADAPMAFGSTLAREQGYSDEVWHERATGASAGCGRATFIAERGEQWVGLATGLDGANGSESTGPVLVAMFVDRTARRMGLGVALVEAVSAWARTCGATRLSLWVTSGNDPAIALYQCCGFQPTGITRPLAHTRTHTEREMRRALAAPVPRPATRP